MPAATVRPSLVIAAFRLGVAALILLPLAAWRCRDELAGLGGRRLAVSVGLAIAGSAGVGTASAAAGSGNLLGDGLAVAGGALVLAGIYLGARAELR